MSASGVLIILSLITEMGHVLFLSILNYNYMESMIGGQFMISKRIGIYVVCFIMAPLCLLSSCTQITSDGSGTSIDIHGVQPPQDYQGIPGNESDPAMDQIGEWETAEETDVTSDLKKIYDSAVTEHPDKKYSIVSYLASRSNKGLDHCFLCNDRGAYKLVCINESYQDEITYIGEAVLDWPGKDANNAPGSWSSSDDSKITDSIRSVIDKVNGSSDEIYTPVIYLGSQTVNGINHAVLCLAEPREPDSPAFDYKLRILNVYEGADGTVQMNEAKDLDIDLYFPAT